MVRSCQQGGLSPRKWAAANNAYNRLTMGNAVWRRITVKLLFLFCKTWKYNYNTIFNIQWLFSTKAVFWWKTTIDLMEDTNCTLFTKSKGRLYVFTPEKTSSHHVNYLSSRQAVARWVNWSFCERPVERRDFGSKSTKMPRLQKNTVSIVIHQISKSWSLNDAEH